MVFAGEIKGSLSNQIISELFYVLTEKINRPLEKEIAAEIAKKYVVSDKWQKVDYDSTTALKAALSSAHYRTSFWDTLVAETMKENEIGEIYTENEKDFRPISGIKMINPFKH